MKTTHYVHYNGASVFVKERDLFVSQGGLREPWGKHWTPVIAESIGDARRQGAALFRVTLSSLFKGEA